MSDFRPSRHGFRFANRFEVPLVGRLLRAAGLPATCGLCGGMVQLAEERFREGRALPPHQRDAPGPGTSLYRTLLRHQIGTFGAPPFFPAVGRFARWTRCNDAALVRCTRRQRRIVTERLREGELIPLGLIYVRKMARLWENHQVLAYGTTDGRNGPPAIRIYDPNEPGRDDVTLSEGASPAAGAAAFEQHRAGRPMRPVRGFFAMA